jgi:uroporphyrinogen-III decarboxylase
MTMRERMLALVQGREHDRVPFVQYGDLAAPDDEVWATVGRENMGILRWVNVHWCETPNCRFGFDGVEHKGRTGYRRTLYTPEGELYEERLFEPSYNSAAAACHFVKEPQDYRVLLAYFRDIAVHKVLEGFHDAVHELGEDGIPLVAVERSPFQQLWVEWVNIQDLVIHLAEYPEMMAEVMAAMTDVQHRVYQVVSEAAREVPIPYVDVPDNITAPVIGEAYFREYCLPAYKELAGLLAKTGKDIPVFVHMDGDLKPLWAAIGESSVRGLDSMSPPPDNDTSVAEALSRWPDMRVCINFPSSVHLAPPEGVYEHTRLLLEEGGHSGRLQIQVSENVPPDAWRTSFPEIVKAIADFG